MHEFKLLKRGSDLEPMDVMIDVAADQTARVRTLQYADPRGYIPLSEALETAYRVCTQEPGREAIVVHLQQGATWPDSLGTLIR